MKKKVNQKLYSSVYSKGIKCVIIVNIYFNILFNPDLISKDEENEILYLPSAAKGALSQVNTKFYSNIKMIKKKLA